MFILLIIIVVVIIKKNIKYLMITPLKGLFSIILKSPSPLSQLRIPTGRRQTSWIFTKRGEFAPSISPRTSPFSSPSWGFEPGSSVFKSSALTTEPRCFLNSTKDADYTCKVLTKMVSKLNDVSVSQGSFSSCLSATFFLPHAF